MGYYVMIYIYLLGAGDGIPDLVQCSNPELAPVHHMFPYVYTMWNVQILVCVSPQTFTISL